MSVPEAMFSFGEKYGKKSQLGTEPFSLLPRLVTHVYSYNALSKPKTQTQMLPDAPRWATHTPTPHFRYTHCPSPSPEDSVILGSRWLRPLLAFDLSGSTTLTLTNSIFKSL